MGRLDEDVLERVESLCDRVLDVSEELTRQQRPRRLVEQVISSGTSVGANAFEADEAISRAEFIKCLSIAVRELNETRFWLRLFARRGWIVEDRLRGLIDDCDRMRKVLGTMIARTRATPGG